MSPDSNLDTAMGQGPFGSHPFFFSDGLFGVLHRPSGTTKFPGWVICNPFGMERTNAHRLNFEWARCLAGAGHWVLRFDYRGTGDSKGSFEEYSVYEYVKDIAKAVSELERLTGMSCRGLMGLRLGASLAAIFGAESDREFELVMWEPISDGRKYRSALLRTAMANELVNSGGPHRSRDDFRREILAGRTVSVDGFPLARPMFDSLASIDLGVLGRPTKKRVILLQMDRQRGLPPRKRFSGLARTYFQGGDTRYELTESPPFWMKTKSFQWRPAGLFESSLKWIESRDSQPLHPTPTEAIESSSIELGDSFVRPIGFSCFGKTLWGILHEPSEVRDDEPSIVMIAAGTNCRSAVFYPALAHDLSAKGWRVLRFDPRGLGDSDGDFGSGSLDEAFSRIESGALVPDVIAAIDFLEREFGTGKCILTGLCGGAITSVLSAAVDSRVVGIMPIELRMRMTRPIAASAPSRAVDRPLWVEFLAQRRAAHFLLTVRRIVHRRRGRLHSVDPNCFGDGRREKSAPSRSRSWYRSAIGDDANIPMLKAFERVFDRALPVLCVQVETEEPKLLDLVLPVLRIDGNHAKSSFCRHVLPGIDHNFTMPGNAQKLSAVLIAWLESQYRHGRPLPSTD
jgi:alpha/beta superfamily hydrolase